MCFQQLSPYQDLPRERGDGEIARSWRVIWRAWVGALPADWLADSFPHGKLSTDPMPPS